MSQFDMREAARLIQLGRRAERRAEATRGCLTTLAARIAVLLLKAFFFMLGVGVVHHDWWPLLPPVGYWTALLVVTLLSGTLSIWPNTREGRS